MTAPFIILSLPRSRSAWLAAFLSYGGLRCGHDIAIDCKTIAEFTGAFGPQMRGTCETGIAFAWRLIRRVMPDAKLVVVYRAVGDVMQSFARLAMIPDEAMAALEVDMWRRSRYLKELSFQSRVKYVPYHVLERESVCAEIFEWCLEMPNDHDWWSRASRMNIQIDFPARMKRLAENANQIAALKAEVMERLRAA